MGGNTQMYYLNGRIDYNEIVTMPRRTTEPPPPPCYDDGMDQCAMFMKYVMYTWYMLEPTIRDSAQFDKLVWISYSVKHND